MKNWVEAVTSIPFYKGRKLAIQKSIVCPRAGQKILIYFRDWRCGSSDKSTLPCDQIPVPSENPQTKWSNLPTSYTAMIKKIQSEKWEWD
jgi:hypothetical protein